MIEATCSACGTLNRVAEANVPVGAKFLTCADCKSRVAIPPPPPPAAIAGGPPAIPKVPRPANPATTSSVIDLADLPAPKRASALGPVPAPAAKPPLPGKPPLRSGLAAALDPELPAPKVMRAPAPTPPSLDLDDLLAAAPAAPAADDGVDLLAPKKAAPRIAPEPARDEVTDLPAPKPNRDISDLPAPKRAAKPDLPDLPTPKDSIAKPPPTITDLPAPKRGPMIPEVPTPRPVDLPPTTSAAAGITDLPAPKGFFDDLPQPALDRGPDLPAPKGFFDDLPQPALHRGADLPAPKGFFDDLPQVKSNPSGVSDVPAPKGFFDDLPQVKSNPGGVSDVPAPKGFFDDIPGLPNTSKPEVPAPKGYFDDIPGLPNTAKPEVPAPKGYFEDIPGLPHTPKPEVPAPKGYFDDIPGLPHTPRPEAPAPKGHFENIPGRPIKKTDDIAPKGFFDDLPQPAHAQALSARGHATVDLVASDLQPVDPELELASPTSGGATFDDLDLLKAPASPVRFEQRAREPAQRPVADEHGARDAGLALELEGGAPSAPVRPAPRPAKAKPVAEEPGAAKSRARRNRIALGVVLLVAALGGGGFVLYQRHAAAQQREAAIVEQLGVARTSYAAPDPQHWQRAAAAAQKVLALDAKNPEALGIGAESLLVSALADGTGATAKVRQARTLLDVANGGGLSSPQIVRARALAALVAHQPDGAIGQLQPLVSAAPKDAALALYLGWALADKGDAAAAIKVFDQAAADPAVKLLALLGRGNAKLALADLDGARADFSSVLEVARDDIAAQVGLAAAQPPSEAQQQEADLVAILARKDIASADPRAVTQAWTLAGYAAMRAGRLDVARERFRKAQGTDPWDGSQIGDLGATTGLAETELRDGNTAVAAELIGKALGVAKDNVPAQLVQSEIEIKQNKLPLATQRLAALANHATPLVPLDKARLHLVTGRLLEAQGKDDAALESYEAGAKAAGGLDLAPLMAAVGKLAAMTQAATQAKDTARADQLRQHAEQLLGDLAAQAAHDARLALTLGVAYLQQGDAAKAEPWLRRAVAARPNDAEARFQLGRALLRSDNHKDALEALNAALTLDPSRADIAGDLARTYEALGRDTEAGALYTKLLSGKEPGIELRSRAGRFFARTGAADKAGEQGSKILEADPRNAAGLYLRGEGLLAAGKALDAKQSFQRAIEIDRDPQYLDALGRAAEALAQTGDRELQDLALRSYIAAAEAAPTMFNPLAGQGRLYVARHEAAKAVTPLLAAAAIDAKNPDVMFLIGAAYQELQQASTALQWLEASMKISPRAETSWRIAQIYRDGNQGPRTAAAVTIATRLAAEAEKHGKPVAWLTDALYLQGRVNLDLQNDAGAREAWRLYVARNPPASAQLTEVRQLLNTRLR